MQRRSPALVFGASELGNPEAFAVGPRGYTSGAFEQTPEERGNDFAARMFSPGMGHVEDPATGSAAAALIGLVARYADNGQHEYRLRQGHEMGRPSLIMLQLRKDEDKLTHGGIGGHAVIVGEGTLNLGD